MNWRNDAQTWINKNGKRKSGRARARSQARLAEKRRFPYGKERPCSSCNGYERWCECCQTFSQDCCVDWGTCLCS